MVIHSSSHVVNMRISSKALIFLLSMHVLLLTTTNAVSREDGEFEGYIKSATYISEKFEMKAGTVSERYLLDIEFPRGHVGVKSFDAELVDENGNSVPLYEAYLYHWFAIRYHQKMNVSHNPNNPLEGSIFNKNDGACNNYLLSHFWGLGGESRGTVSKLLEPFAVELGNHTSIPSGHKEKWLFNTVVIDTRGTHNRKACAQCRCNQMINLPKNFLNVTPDFNGKPLGSDYKGELFCCKDNFTCKLKKDFEAPMRKLALRYTITWVEWNQHQIPVRFYVLDSADCVKRNGSQIIHDCQVEFTIPANRGRDHSHHVQKANIPMIKGGYLIYGFAHMHTDAINATLYGQDGRTLCSSTPKYGKGKKAGNEKGYLVGMSFCHPEPGSIKIDDGEIVTLESRYKRGFLTGAMGHMYIYLADLLPKEPIYRPQTSTLM